MGPGPGQPDIVETLTHDEFYDDLIEEDLLSEAEEPTQVKAIVKYMCSLCYSPFESIALVKEHMIKDHKLKEKRKEPEPVPEVPPAPLVEEVDNDTKEEWLKPIPLKDLKSKLIQLWIYRCTIKGCLYKFESPERRDIHLKCHSSLENVREFQCCYDCGEQKSWRHCAVHLWKVHKQEVDMLKCPLCTFKAKNTVTIFQHLQVHGSNKGFPCLDCPKVFPQYTQLQKHSLCHLDIQKQSSVTRWYSQKTCQICNNVFANSKTLSKHMKRHNKIVSHRCNICGKGSTNKQTWLIHSRQHTGEKPLKCNVCPFNARDPSVLRKHQLRHTLTKPYKCNLCDYSAIQTIPFKTHIRTNHPEEFEKMKCSLCKFISVNQKALQRHYNDHKAGLVKTDEETKNESEASVSKAQLSRQPDHHRIKLSEVSSDCFLPLESTDPHDPPLDIGGVTIPAHSEDTQFTIF